MCLDLYRVESSVGLHCTVSNSFVIPQLSNSVQSQPISTPSLISRTVSVDVKHHIYLLTQRKARRQKTVIIAKTKLSSSSWHLYLLHDNNQLSLGEKIIKLHACIIVNAVEKASKSAQSAQVCVSNGCTSFVRLVQKFTSTKTVRTIWDRETLRPQIS